MANWPCRNRSCHSFGAPHPNCLCAPPLAKGGPVDHFCSEDRAHNEGCEYFAAGGKVPSFDDMVDGGTPKPAAALPSFDEIPDHAQASTAAVPSFDKMPDESSKYETTGQKIATGAEGFAHGVAGPVATWAESHPVQTGLIAAGPLGWGTLLADKFLGNKTAEGLDKGISEKLGMTPQDIAGRQKANPWIHGVSEGAGIVGGLLTGAGEAGLITKGAGAITKAMRLQKSAALIKAAIEGASFALSDELTKSILHQPGSDPAPTVGAALLHMGANGILSAAGAPLFGLAGKGLDYIGGEKMAEKMTDFLLKFSDRPITKSLSATGSAKLIGLAEHVVPDPLFRWTVGGGAWSMVRKHLEGAIDKMGGKPLARANKYASDAVLSMLQEGKVFSVPSAMKLGKAVGQAMKNSVLPGVEAIFKTGVKDFGPPLTDSLIDELHEMVKGGTVPNEISEANSMAPAGFARGGEVPPQEDHFANGFPAENALLHAARGRIFNYLNSVRPQPNGQRLAFDAPPVDHAKEKAYRNALQIAACPVEVLRRVNKGTLTPEDVHAFKTMYPETHRLMAHHLTERITQAQLKDEAPPPYGKRQALSLFLGANLDSSLTPQAIMAAQGVFQKKKAAQQPPQSMKKRKAPALSKIAEATRTDDESRMARAQKV